MDNCWQKNMQATANDDLQAMSREQLHTQVKQLRSLLAVQDQTIREIVDERNAARLLIELFQY